MKNTKEIMDGPAGQVVVWNGTALDFAEGGAFVAAVRDHRGHQFVGIYSGGRGVSTGVVAQLDRIDLDDLEKAIALARQGLGW